MATGGAWTSETFDNTDAAATGSATPPAMYNVVPPPGGRKPDSRAAFGVTALSLRVAQILFTLIAFSLMAANKEVTFYTIDETQALIKFSSVKSFVGVLALNCIVCVYAIAQLVHCCVSMSTKGSFMSSATKGFAMLTFASDTVLAYGLIGAAAAGADSAAYLSEENYCSLINKFCQIAEASVAISFLAFVSLAVSAALYPVRLLRLTSKA